MRSNQPTLVSPNPIRLFVPSGRVADNKMLSTLLLSLWLLFDENCCCHSVCCSTWSCSKLGSAISSLVFVKTDLSAEHAPHTSSARIIRDFFFEHACKSSCRIVSINVVELRFFFFCYLQRNVISIIVLHSSQQLQACPRFVPGREDGPALLSSLPQIGLVSASPPFCELTENEQL